MACKRDDQLELIMLNKFHTKMCVEFFTRIQNVLMAETLVHINSLEGESRVAKSEEMKLESILYPRKHLGVYVVGEDDDDGGDNDSEVYKQFTVSQFIMLDCLKIACQKSAKPNIGARRYTIAQFPTLESFLMMLCSGDSRYRYEPDPGPNIPAHVQQTRHHKR
ncbi:hypothetical protein VTN96DRAFT_9357 [Rasamsonia emersonii]